MGATHLRSGRFLPRRAVPRLFSTHARAAGGWDRRDGLHPPASNCFFFFLGKKEKDAAAGSGWLETDGSIGGDVADFDLLMLGLHSSESFADGGGHTATGQKDFFFRNTNRNRCPRSAPPTARQREHGVPASLQGSSPPLEWPNSAQSASLQKNREKKSAHSVLH